MANKVLSKKLKSLFSLITINTVLILIVLEIVPLIFFSLKEKRFLYTQRSSQGELKKSLESTGIRLSQDINQSLFERLHPFFGYVLKPNAFTQKELNIKVNNEGFFSYYNYPYIKQHQKQFIVGIFGGSVAGDVSLDEAIHYTAPQSLTQHLKALLQIPEQDIIILNFTNGGYKQPQQLFILNYFLSMGQEFDLVINIDGFNEVALSNLNNKANLELAMPSVQHLQPLAGLANSDLDVLLSLADLSRTKKQLIDVIEKSEQCKLAICYAANYYQFQQLLNLYQKQINELQIQENKKRSSPSQEQLVFIPKLPSSLEDEYAFQKMVKIWSESSLMMHQILTARNIPYFHFVQPNQYYKTSRQFTGEEQKLKQGSLYQEGVEKGYPVLLSQVEKLQQSGVNIFSAVEIFDQTKEAVYRDNCCHYNRLGKDILTGYISDTIIKDLQSNKYQKYSQLNSQKSNKN